MEGDSNDLTGTELNFLGSDALTQTPYDNHPSSIHSALLEDKAPEDSADTSAPGAVAAGSGDGSPAFASTSTAPTGGASRKQNVACDACRAKKIRCRRKTTTEVCEQCVAKGGECTSNYIEQLQIKARARKSRGGENGDTPRKRPRTEENEDELDPALRRNALARNQSYSRTVVETPAGKGAVGKQANLVRYLLAPRAVTDVTYGYTDLSSVEQCERGVTDLWEEQAGAVWKEEPTEAHAGLADAAIRLLANDFVETFFTLIHPRFGLLDTPTVRQSISNPDFGAGAVPHNLLAIIIAFGARFSDHPTVVADREACVARDNAQFGEGSRPPRSRLVQLLIIRAREVVEAQKTHRIANHDNTRVLLFMEGLLGQPPFLKDSYYPYNFAAAVSHITRLGYNTSKGLAAIADQTERSFATRTWSWACSVDGFRAVFHRYKPLMSGDGETAAQQPLDASDPASIWVNAAPSAAVLCRRLCADLWSPQATSSGIKVDDLKHFIQTAITWRDTYLSQFGVPNKWPEGWTFETAIANCGTDAYFHTLWLVVHRAVQELGVADKDGTEVEPLKRIADEAEHSALRITALISMLLLNQYLRLDPLVLHHPMYEAGLYLAERGREECLACVAGLRQYSVAYPQFWGQAEEIERLYNAGLIAETSAAGQQDTMNAVEASLNGVMSALEPKDAGSVEAPEDKQMEEKDLAQALFEWLQQL